MSFSTWSDLVRKMRDDFAKGNWRTRSYDFDGVRKEFVSPKEFFEMLAIVEARAEGEASGGPSLRTSARGMNR
jgi:hypothetical protein